MPEKTVDEISENLCSENFPRFAS